jgi:hypothetical protein
LLSLDHFPLTVTHSSLTWVFLSVKWELSDSPLLLNRILKSSTLPLPCLSLALAGLWGPSQHWVVSDPFVSPLQGPRAPPVLKATELGMTEKGVGL